MNGETNAGVILKFQFLIGSMKYITKQNYINAIQVSIPYRLNEISSFISVQRDI